MTSIRTKNNRELVSTTFTSFGPIGFWRQITIPPTCYKNNVPTPSIVGIHNKFYCISDHQCGDHKWQRKRLYHRYTRGSERQSPPSIYWNPYQLIVAFLPFIILLYFFHHHFSIIFVRTHNGFIQYLNSWHLFRKAYLCIYFRNSFLSNWILIASFDIRSFA